MFQVKRSRADRDIDTDVMIRDEAMPSCVDM